MKHPTLRELLGYLDGELAARVKLRVASHVEECAACREELQGLSMTSAKISGQELERSEENADAMVQQRTALRARLEEMAAHASAHEQPVLRWSRSLAYAAVLLVLIGAGWILLEPRSKAHEQAKALPNPAFTPGAVRRVSLDEICAANDDEVVRKVPAAMQQRVFGEYGMSHAPPGDFEVDYLITPGLGGSDDVANLWPQPHRSEWNSYVKDQLEDRLHHMVCRGQISLPDAQSAIASNWIDAYRRYFHTDQPLRAAGHVGGHSGEPLDVAAEPLQRLALLR